MMTRFERLIGYGLGAFFASSIALAQNVAPGVPVAANPTATAGGAAVNGSATTFMRSDAAPAVATASTSTFGVMKPDGTTETATAGVISTAATTINGTPCTPGGSCSPPSAATSITPGTTTVAGATAPCAIQNSTGTAMVCTTLAGSLVTVADTTHTVSAATANIGGQDDYNGSSITATLATLATGQTLLITDQNATALTVSNNSQTVNGLPLSTTLHTGGFYGYAYNTTTLQISAFGFPGFGTITTGAFMLFDDATGAATAGPTPGTGVTTALAAAVGTSGSLVTNGGALGTPSSGTGTNITNIPNNNVNATSLPTPGSGATLSGPRSYYTCTTTCTVTLPTPAAGYEFCVLNDDNVSTVITMAAISGVQFENTARTSYKTANTSIVSAGAVGDKSCWLGRDATHYLSVSYTGTWS
jgi:hypothetical protein